MRNPARPEKVVFWTDSSTGIVYYRCALINLNRLTGKECLVTFVGRPHAHRFKHPAATTSRYDLASATSPGRRGRPGESWRSRDGGGARRWPPRQCKRAS